MSYVVLTAKERPGEPVFPRLGEVVFAGPDGVEVLRVTLQNPRWKTPEYRALMETIDQAVKRHSKVVEGRHTVRAVEKALS